MVKIEELSEIDQKGLKTDKISDIQPRRSSRIVMQKSLDEFNSARNEGGNDADEGKSEEEEVEEEQKTKTTKIGQRCNVIRRFPSRSSRNWTAKKRRIDEELPTDYDELKQKTETGEIPSTVFYRASSNSMYIPLITADMIQDNGTSLTVKTASDDYFKYVRVRQKTKIDHADPEKVLEIIDAVRRRPIIWDQRLVCHQNMSFIRRAWQQLDVELGLSEEYPLVRRRQIWKNKKDYFSLAVNTSNLNKWIFADAMEFYRPMIKFRATVLLRPTVPIGTSSASEAEKTSSTNTFDKLILANKSVRCKHSDRDCVMTFLLKSLHETGMANAEMMTKHGEKILEIFQKNLKKLGAAHQKS